MFSYRIWNLITDPRCRQAVESAARFAEGTLTEGELRAAERDASSACDLSRREKSEVAAYAEYAARDAAMPSSAELAAQRACNYAYVAAGDAPDAGPEHDAQCHLLRDIIGNPFRPVTIDPTWLTPTVVSLAAGIYSERAFDRLPILADALQDAGCDNTDILNHCRGDGPHVRGCWVVDLHLGKG
jgi:hypothetical protein